MNEEEKFRKRWNENWWIRFHPIKGKRILDTLVGMYSSQERKYHNLKHINECLDELDLAREQGLVKHPVIMEMALTHHDALYDTKRKDNEEKSAALLFLNLKSMGFFKWARKIGYGYVMATKHNVIPGDEGARIVVDIDLSILGKSWERYEEYMRAIRQEYKWVEEKAFREGRAKVMQGFLDRERVYLTDFFREKYERQARDNVKREIELLNSSV